MEELNEKELLRMMKMAETIKSCSTCGSKPFIEFNKQLGKFIVRCPKCKDMFVMTLLLDAAKRRWEEIVTWRNRVNEVYEHNKKVMEKIEKGGVIRLSSITPLLELERKA